MLRVDVACRANVACNAGRKPKESRDGRFSKGSKSRGAVHLLLTLLSYALGLLQAHPRSVLAPSWGLTTVNSRGIGFAGSVLTLPLCEKALLDSLY